VFKISENTIEIIADSIAQHIKQGRLLKLTDDEENRLRRRSERLSKPLELDFRKGIVALFKEQRDLVIAVLQGREKSIEKDVKKNANKAMAVPVSKSEIAKFTKYTLPKITEMVMIAGNSALTELEVGVAFDVLNPRVVDWLREHAAEAVKGIGDTTKAALKKTLLEGIENGESIAKLTKRVQAEYKHLELEKWRAKRIALNETKTATNKGNFEGMKQSGLTGKKGILLGPKPCEICLGYAAMGLIDLNATWDGFDAPTFHVGCQCDIYFVPD